MVYPKAKLKSNGETASPCFKTFLLENMSDILLPTPTLLYISVRHIFISVPSFTVNNDDINELYLTQIPGLWGSSPLSHTHGSSSYIKTMAIAQDIAANWCTRQLLLHSTTHTFPERKAGSDQIKTKRKRRKIFSSYAKSAYKEMKA